MSSSPQPKPPNQEVITESSGVFMDLTNVGVVNPPGAQPIRNLASLRLLVRERVLRGMPPLPEGFQLPPGITLDDVLKPPPSFPI